MATRWWWVRHAPVVNPEGLICGQSDFKADLSDTGKFDVLAGNLPENAVWVTTSLCRANETAKGLSRLVPIDGAITEDDGLREQSFGDWEGARWDDIPAGVSEAYWRDPVANRTPNGEGFADVASRVSRTIERMNAEHGGRDIVAVAHAGSIRAAIGLALDGGLRSSLSFRISPLSLTRIDVADGEGGDWSRVCGVNLYGDPL